MAGEVSGDDLNFSHHATLQLTHRGIVDYCEATIINSLLLVTVAHCVSKFNARQMRVITGRRNLKTPERTQQVRNIRGIIQHEQYNNVTHDNDIALLVLDRPLNFDSYTRPVEILGGNKYRKKDALVTGWGLGPTDDNIQQVRAELEDQQECRLKFKGRGQKVTDNMLCAVMFPSSYCNLSGEPLLCKRESSSKHYLCGIASWGLGCIKKRQWNGFPEVFTDVSKYHVWITDHMWQYQGGRVFRGSDADYRRIWLQGGII